MMASKESHHQDARYDALCTLLSARLGLCFPPQSWRDLDRRIASAAPHLGYPNVAACLDGLLTKSLEHKELEILASHLTVGESYFFRDPATFAVLQQSVLPELVQRRREVSPCIRVWSAGCSSGEEAYSLAMALTAFLGDARQWRASVVATDINPQALAIAREGVYGHWSLRAPVPSWARGWLVPQPGGRQQVVPTIKSIVHVGWLNLMEDPYPSVDTNTSAMDVIFCRNVLMYFHPDHVRQVLERFAACLVDGGWLVVSPVETSLVTIPMFTACHLSGAIFFRKTAGATTVVRETDSRPQQEIPVAASAYDEALAPPLPQPSKSDGIVPKPADAAEASLIQQARDMANRGLLTEALALCDKVMTHDGLDAAWTFLRASVLIELSEIEEAMVALRRSIYLDHDFAMAHFTLANLLLGCGRKQEAYRHFRNTLELLSVLDAAVVLPEAAGITAGRLTEIVSAALAQKEAS